MATAAWPNSPDAHFELLGVLAFSLASFIFLLFVGFLGACDVVSEVVPGSRKQKERTQRKNHGRQGGQNEHLSYWPLPIRKHGVSEA
jgi:hypothetical protein